MFPHSHHRNTNHHKKKKSTKNKQIRFKLHLFVRGRLADTFIEQTIQLFLTFQEDVIYKKKLHEIKKSKKKKICI